MKFIALILPYISLTIILLICYMLIKKYLYQKK